jgi:hypothetical protein
VRRGRAFQSAATWPLPQLPLATQHRQHTPAQPAHTHFISCRRLCRRGPTTTPQQPPTFAPGWRASRRRGGRTSTAASGQTRRRAPAARPPAAPACGGRGLADFWCRPGETLFAVGDACCPLSTAPRGGPSLQDRQRFCSRLLISQSTRRRAAALLLPRGHSNPAPAAPPRRQACHPHARTRAGLSGAHRTKPCRLRR